MKRLLLAMFVLASFSSFAANNCGEVTKGQKKMRIYGLMTTSEAKKLDPIAFSKLEDNTVHYIKDMVIFRTTDQHKRPNMNFQYMTKSGESLYFRPMHSNDYHDWVIFRTTAEEKSVINCIHTLRALGIANNKYFVEITYRDEGDIKVTDVNLSEKCQPL